MNLEKLVAIMYTNISLIYRKFKQFKPKTELTKACLYNSGVVIYCIILLVVIFLPYISLFQKIIFNVVEMLITLIGLITANYLLIASIAVYTFRIVGPIWAYLQY